MFFENSRISAVREMILAETPESRRAALQKILPMQRQDFAELFEIMEGRPVCIRLLDPPLHEFLPRTEREVTELSRVSGVAPDVLRRRIANLEEYNPMLGHRGCRLAVSFPEIAEVQARAIFEAAIAATEKLGRPVTPEIMVPLVAARQELDYVKAIIARVAVEVSEAAGQPVAYQVGTMIELPRAALMAEDIAQSAAFFSFGTNDLTQTTFGISRDDAASFLPTYLQKGVFPRDPFVSIDRDGVGELIRIAIERGRKSRPDIGLGMCGEHGGDPQSIAFCEEAGLSYVSCSPFRTPIARLAAARAVVLGRKVNR
jgi:pyruvate,orthophosphate dikinase